MFREALITAATVGATLIPTSAYACPDCAPGNDPVGAVVCTAENLTHYNGPIKDVAGRLDDCFLRP